MDPEAAQAVRPADTPARPSGPRGELMLIDLHAHTSPRSNCSRTTLEELVVTARSHGLDALCITEHDVRWPDDELADAYLGTPPPEATS